MIYSLLIHEVPGVSDARSPDEREGALAAHRSLREDTQASGAFVAAIQLSESGATTVRHDKGEPLVTDGPFAETKELFIGLYLFDCANLDEALRLAKRIPVSQQGSVEVRPTIWADAIELSPE